MEFQDEIKSYSIDDLELIIHTQKELYTEDEMRQLKEQLFLKREEEENARKAKVAEKKRQLLAQMPSTISCQKCAGPNSIDNVVCNYCGATLDKKRLYTEIEELTQETHNQQCVSDTEKNTNDHTFHRVISFLIPIVGFIVGAIMLASENEPQRESGKTCILLAILSVVVCTLFVSLVI